MKIILFLFAAAQILYQSDSVGPCEPTTIPVIDSVLNATTARVNTLFAMGNPLTIVNCRVTNINLTCTSQVIIENTTIDIVSLVCNSTSTNSTPEPSATPTPGPTSTPETTPTSTPEPMTTPTPEPMTSTKRKPPSSSESNESIDSNESSESNESSDSNES
ncbi:protein psiD-like isoform X2 [Chiloscyllium plagiosum]|uniref:protein psiD-like isoform X2 n=1 Tax=Chiloscyllium plagiosum TaxID=36176 RepID=UPI001CB7CC26|nr:protein psiD-like isoform X2 [Chiloscyllium plagiosum]